MLQLGWKFLYLILTLCATIWYGFVGATLWNWWIVPFFPFLPEMTTIMAVGIRIALGLFNGTYIPDGTKLLIMIKQRQEYDIEEIHGDLMNIVMWIMIPSMYLLWGWFFLFFI